MPDAVVRLWPAAFAPEEASQLFDALIVGIDWRQEEVLIFGQRRPVPRLAAWHGDPGASYTYSGTSHDPLRWTQPLERIRSRLLELTGSRFNSVLLNQYRDGRDGMGWHADDEPELGRDPVIASVSLGAQRRFCFRHRRDRNLKLDVTLSHGSLLLMSGATQAQETTTAGGLEVQLGGYTEFGGKAGQVLEPGPANGDSSVSVP